MSNKHQSKINFFVWLKFKEQLGHVLTKPKHKQVYMPAKQQLISIDIASSLDEDCSSVGSAGVKIKPCKLLGLLLTRWSTNVVNNKGSRSCAEVSVAVDVFI